MANAVHSFAIWRVDNPSFTKEIILSLTPRETGFIFNLYRIFSKDDDKLCVKLSRSAA